MHTTRIPARIAAQDSDHLTAVWHETVVTVFRGPATLQAVLNIGRTCEGLLAAARGPVTYLSVIERSSPAPTETVRRELATWSRDVVTRLALAVIVAEGGGFKNALVRGVGVALTVLLPHKVPFKFVNSVPEGASLLAPFLPENAGGPVALSAVIDAARQRWQAGVNGAVG